VEQGIPAYGAPDLAVNAIAALREYARMKEDHQSVIKPCSSDAHSAAIDIISKARSDGRSALTEIEAKQVFKAYGLPIAETSLATSEEEAVALAKKIGYPLVMKIVSPEILHKSDAGGVK